MSTRSIIGIKEEGKFTGVYCHYDGYPQHHLPILEKHYNTSDKLRELIDYGDISSLGVCLESCVFYTRDRGGTFKGENRRFFLYYTGFS